MFTHDLAQKDCIFIEYEDLIRCTSFAVLKFLLAYKDFYKDDFDMEYLSKLDDKKLMRLCVQRSEKNILKYLNNNAKGFPCKETLASIYDNDAALFAKSQVLDLVPSMIHYLGEKYSGELFIYYPVNDSRVKIDIQNLFLKSEQVHFIYGNIFDWKEVIDNCNLFIVSSLELLTGMLESGYGEGREYLLAYYGYNMDIDYKTGEVNCKFDYNLYAKEKGLKFKFGMIQPLSMDQTYFD